MNQPTHQEVEVPPIIFTRDDRESKRRKLTLVNGRMARRKTQFLELVRAQTAGAHTLSIQYIRPGNGRVRTTCPYPASPSPSSECRTGEYRVSLEPYCFGDAISKDIPEEPLASFVRVQATTTRRLHGRAKQNNVRWFCLKCFEHKWKYTSEELSASEALQTPDYDPLARLRRSIMPESRSEMTGANLDLDVPHQMAFYRWCGFHTHIEYESGEIPKDHCMRQGPEGEWMDGDDAISLSVTKISGAAYFAKIDLNFVRGKKLSQIFEDLDNSVIPEEQARRKAIEEARQRQHDRAARHKRKFADEKVMTAFRFADAIEPRNEEFETQQIEQREATKQGYSTIALTTSIERWLQGITTPSP
ncbi:MAG: hypothetical protein Q9202_003196 [Teloschistes flavicans]